MGLILARVLVRLGLQDPPPARTRTKTILPEPLVASLRGLETERMVAMFVDGHGRLSSHELVAEGDSGQLKLSLRRIFTKALSRDARRMILAHNHPSGCAEPSESDIANTRRLSEFASSLGIALEDHLIVGADAITSMRERALLG